LSLNLKILYIFKDFLFYIFENIFLLKYFRLVLYVSLGESTDFSAIYLDSLTEAELMRALKTLISEAQVIN